MKKTPSRRGRALMAFVVTVSTLVFGGTSVIDSSDNFVTLLDVQGPDDVNGQSDLVSTELDTSHLDDPNPVLWVRWTWDETAYSGKNTGDACALFDTDGDGNANDALCVTIGGTPAAQTADSPRLYSCGSDSRNDRCGGATEVTSLLSSCSVVISGGDTIATCAINMDDVGGGGAQLLNTCSFNSREPNSNPPDCVLQPGMGVTVVKDVTDDAPVTSEFEVAVSGSGVIPGTTVGDGSFFLPLTNGTHSAAEVVVPTGYTLTDSTCTSGSPSAFTLALGGVEAVTCTFTNSPTPSGSPSMAAAKSFADASVAAGTTGHMFTISVENDGDVALSNVVVTDAVAAALTLSTVTADLAGDCSSTSGNSVSCTIPSIPVGQTATVAVAYTVDESIEPTTIANTATVIADEIPTPQTASDSVAVTEDVSLAVAKAFTANPVAAGTTANSFTIAVSNSGTSDAENVSITDTVDPSLTVTGVTASPSADCSASAGQNVDCTIAELSGSGSATITVTYDVDESAAAGTISNSASATSDEVTTPVTGTTSVSVVEDVDLSVVKAFAVDPVAAGSTDQTLSITVTNNGASDAENVAFGDVLAAALTVTDVSSSTADCAASTGQTAACTIASLGSGQSASAVVTFDVAESATPATIVNTASATSDEVAVPVTGSDTVEIVEDVSFGVAKTFGTASAPAGSTGLTFTIEFTNTGLSDAENVRATDTVDPALTVTGASSATADCSASAGQNVDCSIASLAAGATATITVTYDIDEGVDPGPISNTTLVTSDEVTTPAIGSGSTDVTEDVSITATKVFSPATAAAGSNGNTFALTVTNDGLSDADNVSITDLVDPTLELTAVSIAPIGDCSASAGQTVDCTVPSLGGGQTVVVSVTYELDSGASPGPIVNSMTVSSDEDSTSATSSVDVVADVAFQVSKAFDAPSVVAGSTGHTFTISVTNSESSDATDVSITDSVDAALTVTSITSPTADCSGSVGQTVSCSQATLAAGDTATVTVTYAVADSVDGATIPNTAAANANEIASPVTASDSIDVVEDVTLTATKTFTDSSVAAGTAGHTFTLVVSNSGASDADNVTISDVVPADLVVTSVISPDTNCAASAGQTIACSLANLAGGDSITVTVGYDVSASAEASTVSNNATISSDEATVNVSDSIDVFEDVTLELKKAFSDADVAAGIAGSTFTITLDNTGVSDAENISIIDLVDPALTVVAVASATADCAASGGQTVDCSIASLAPGGSATVTVTYDVDESTAPGTISNTAAASSDEGVATAGDSIEIVEDVDLAVTKTFSPDSAVAGSDGNSFTISVANSGVSDAENVTITDLVDAGLAVTGVAATPSGDCSATSGNAIDCAIATLAAGAATTVIVTYDVPATTDTSTIANTATASSDEAGPVTGNDSIDVTEVAVLTASKTFSDSSVVAGSTGHTFTLDVTNTGISTADDVSITDTVGPGLTVTGTTITPTGDCSASTGNSINCSVASLGAGQTASVTVAYDVPAGTDTGTVANTASVDSEETTTPLSPTDTIDISEDVALAVVKTFAPDSVAAGTSGNSLTIVVSNSGLSDADNLRIVDAVDAQLTVTAATMAPAGSCAPIVANAIDCSLGSLAPGASATVTINYDVPATGDAVVITNTADATSDEVLTAVSGSDTLTVTEDVALTVSKSFAVDPVVAGSIGNTFSIAVTNTGTSNADNVVMTDAVDPALTVTGVSISPAGSCSATAGNNVSCTAATIGPDTTATLTVTFDVPEATAAGTISNTASAVSDEVSTPATGTDTVTVSEDVVLSATKSFAVDPVVAGSAGNTFTIVATNSGQSDADNVTITDAVDATLTVTDVSVAPVGDCSATLGNAVDCSVPSLAAGASVTVTVTFAVPETTDPTTINNTASVDSDEIVVPLAPTDDLTIGEDVDLSITKTFATATATAGVNGYSFAMAVTNTGRSDAENVRITDNVGVDLTVVSVTGSSGGDCTASSGQTIDCTWATLGSGATATVTTQYAVGAAVTTPQIETNTASATSAEVTTAISATDTVSLDSVVSFDSEKVFAASSVASGSTGNTFTIAVANSGPSDASGITIDDLVDARLEVTGVSIAPIGDCSASSGQTVACTVPSMTVGEATVVTVTYDVAGSIEAATIVNSAQVDSAVPASTTTVSTSVDVVEDVDLSLAKSFVAASVAAGSTGNSFSITVTNAGLSDAENVVITDVVDPALTVTAASIGLPGSCAATVGNTVSCTVASLAGGSTATITAFYDVDESQPPTTINNTASVVSDEVTTAVTGADSVEIVEDVDLSVIKSFSPTTVSAGTAGYSFTISVANSGLSDAENVVVSDLVNGSLTVTDAIVSPSGDCSATSGNLVSCSVSQLDAGATATVTVFYDVDAAAPAALITNTASAVSDEVTAPVDGSDAVDIVKDVVLAVVKSFTDTTVVAGTGGHTFSIVVTNSGASDATDVSIMDTVDTGLVVTAASVSPPGDCSASSGNAVDCTLATLAAGATATLTVTYSVPATTDTATISNTASAMSDEVTTPVTGSATVDAVEDVDLSLVKTFTASPVVAGSSGNMFTIAVTNSGVSDADGVVLTDVVDSALTVTGATISPAGDCAATSGNAVSCTVSSLAPGATATLTVAYDVGESIDPALVTNTAEATSDEVTAPIAGSDSVAVIEDVSLTVAKAFASTPVVAGTSGHAFTIAVTNTGLSDAENVRVIDVVDTSLSVTGVAAIPTGDCSASSGNTVDCSVATLSAGSTATLTVGYDLDAATETTTISNTATATSDEVTTPVPGSATVDAVEDVDLSLVKTFTASPVVAGSTGNSLTLAATNSGTSEADNVLITDIVDPTLIVTGASMSPAGDCSATTGNAVSCTAATLGPGATTSVTVVYDVADSTDPAVVANTATVTSDEVTAPVEGSASVTIVEDVELTVVKSFSAPSVNAGTGGHTFSIAVTNTGASDAENVRITDAVDDVLVVSDVAAAPSGDCSAGAGNDVDCTVATLAAGETATVTVVYDVAPAASTSSIINVAAASSEEVPTPVESSATVRIARSTDLTVDKSSSPDPYVPGDMITYTIVVTNAGPSTSTAVTLTEAMPDGLTDVVFTPADGVYDAVTGSWTGLAIAAGGSATMTITATVPPGQVGTLVNTVSVVPADGALDHNLLDNTDVAQNPTDVAADLSLTKTLDTTEPLPGTPVHYTIVVRNDGTGVALDAVVSDPIDGMVTDVTWSCSATGSIIAACGEASGMGDVATLVSLLPGDSVLVEITGVLAPDSDGMLTNTATVSVEGDPDVSDNSATAAVMIQESADLQLVKTTTDTPAAVGDRVAYELTATNRGPSAARNVVVTDTLPAGTRFKTAASQDGSCSEADGVVTCQVGSIADGASAVMVIEVEMLDATAGTAVVNHAAVASDSSDPLSTNNQSRATVNVRSLDETPVLPTTGSDPTYLARLAMILALGGLMLLVTARRRRGAHRY